MTIKWAIRQYNVNIQRLNMSVVSIRSTWQGRHGAWLIDMPPRMVSLQLTPAVQRDYNHSTMAICFRVHTRVRLGVTVFCILPLPRVTFGITTKEVNVTKMSQLILYFPMANWQWPLTWKQRLSEWARWSLVANHWPVCLHRNGFCDPRTNDLQTVSYTHLTLPTIYSV